MIGGINTSSSMSYGLSEPKAGYESSPSECKTCASRKYQDGSDEAVSFKAASHISPEAAASAVRGHEQEHVSNAYAKASMGDGEVVSASVSIHTSICPECGRTYVSGGTTSSVIKYSKDTNADATTSIRLQGQEDFPLEA